jgi:hypothetical protein
MTVLGSSSSSLSRSTSGVVNLSRQAFAPGGQASAKSSDIAGIFALGRRRVAYPLPAGKSRIGPEPVRYEGRC